MRYTLEGSLWMLYYEVLTHLLAGLPGAPDRSDEGKASMRDIG